MIELVRRFGGRGLSTLQNIGSSGGFLLKVLFRVPDFRRLWPSLRSQLYFVGVLSTLVIVVSALFIGMVVGLQGYNTLEKFGLKRGEYAFANSYVHAHKNVRVLMDAFSGFDQTRTLVLFGTSQRADYEARGIKVPTNVRFLGRVLDEIGRAHV